MAEELDTSWFDLKNYEYLKTISIVDWASVLRSRGELKENHDYYLDLVKKNDFDSREREDQEYWLHEFVNEIKTGGFSLEPVVDVYINEEYPEEISQRKQPFSTFSVNSLENHQAWEMVNEGSQWPGQELTDFQNMRDEWLRRPWEDEDKEEYHSLIRKAAYSPYDFHFKQYLYRNYFSSSAHVVINLNAPDEKIINNFRHWLKHFRKESGYRVPKKKAHEKLFNQKIFDDWIELGLIPYLDLVIIAKIEGKKITQKKLGELIFPNEFDIDTEYRIGHSTKPETERLIKTKAWDELMYQAAEWKMNNQHIAS